MNVGGRPLASWPAFVIPSYELTILFSALTAAIGMIVLNGLPQPYHPVFNVRALLAGELRQVLPGHRGRRPASSAGDQTSAFLRGPGREGSVRRCGITVTRCCAVAGARASSAAARRLPPGHARRAALRGVRGEPVVRRRPRLAQPAGGHRRARLAARRRALYTGKVDGELGRRVPVRDRPRRSDARPGALQHLLHAVPRPARRRQGHGGAARAAPGGQRITRIACARRSSATSST